MIEALGTILITPQGKVHIEDFTFNLNVKKRKYPDVPFFAEGAAEALDWAAKQIRAARREALSEERI